MSGVAKSGPMRTKLFEGLASAYKRQVNIDAGHALRVGASDGTSGSDSRETLVLVSFEWQSVQVFQDDADPIGARTRGNRYCSRTSHLPSSLTKRGIHGSSRKSDSPSPSISPSPYSQPGSITCKERVGTLLDLRLFQVKVAVVPRMQSAGMDCGHHRLEAETLRRSWWWCTIFCLSIAYNLRMWQLMIIRPFITILPHGAQRRHRPCFHLFVSPRRIRVLKVTGKEAVEPYIQMVLLLLCRSHCIDAGSNRATRWPSA